MKSKKNQKIAVTGLSGVIGSVLIDTLPQNLDIIELSRRFQKTPKKNIRQHIKIDLLEEESIKKALSTAEPEMIVHMAAVTHIDECEKDRINKKEGIVWKTNVTGTDYITKFAKKNHIPVIYISTECVFDGKKQGYKEGDKKNPINWYGITKSEAEDIVLGASSKNSILRSVVAYHKEDRNNTILGKFRLPLSEGKALRVVADQNFTPTYTHDITLAIKKIIQQKRKGIFHVVPKKSLTPFEFAHQIAAHYKLETSKIVKTTLSELYGPERASLRLKNAWLVGNKTNSILHIKPKSVHKVLRKKRIKE